MPVGSVAAVPMQMVALLSSLQQTQSAELALATQLGQGATTAAAASNPALGQLVNLSA